MPSFPAIVYNNKFGLPSLPPPGTFKDQTIIITGATGGLGLATAVHFVNLGASRVVITGRTLSRCQTAKSQIDAQTTVKDTSIVQCMELDMSTFAGVTMFVGEVKKEVKKVDYVLLNAGMFPTAHRLGKEGLSEESIEVNTLSTVLLGVLLLPWMKKVGGGKAHLGFVTSGLHRGIDISPSKFPQSDILAHFANPENFPKATEGIYARNKLLLQYCVREIAKLAVGPDGSPQVIVNPMCPGMVKSDLARGFKTGFLMSFAVDTFMNLASKTTEGGARTLVLAALTNKEENGKHYTNYQSEEDYEKAVQHNILSPEGIKMQAEVWKEVTAVLEKKVPEVKEIVDGV